MPLPENAAFIVRGDDGEEYGPVELTELREWVRENRAGLGTNVRLDEPGSTWKPWQAYPELVALLAEANATGLPAGTVALVMAPLPRRMAAFVLDFVLALILLMPILRVVLACLPPEVEVQLSSAFQGGAYHEPQLPMRYFMIVNLAFYGVILLYGAGFTWAHGQTPAKTLFRLRVVDGRGMTPNAGAALVRALIICISLMFWFPLLFVFLHPQRRALHDLAAGTCVVEA